MTLTLEGPFDVGSTFVHLKRVWTVTPEGLYISATSNHLKKLLKLTDLTENSKGKDTPITKSSRMVTSLQPSCHQKKQRAFERLLESSCTCPLTAQTFNMSSMSSVER